MTNKKQEFMNKFEELLDVLLEDMALTDSARTKSIYCNNVDMMCLNCKHCELRFKQSIDAHLYSNFRCTKHNNEDKNIYASCEEFTPVDIHNLTELHEYLSSKQLKTEWMCAIPQYVLNQLVQIIAARIMEINKTNCNSTCKNSDKVKWVTHNSDGEVSFGEAEQPSIPQIYSEDNSAYTLPTPPKVNNTASANIPVLPKAEVFSEDFSLFSGRKAKSRKRKRGCKDCK